LGRPGSGRARVSASARKCLPIGRRGRSTWGCGLAAPYFDQAVREEEFVGREADTLTEHLGSRGYLVRRWDAEAATDPSHPPRAWTADHRSNRLNIWVEQGHVVKAFWAKRTARTCRAGRRTVTLRHAWTVTSSKRHMPRVRSFAVDQYRLHPDGTREPVTQNWEIICPQCGDDGRPREELPPRECWPRELQHLRGPWGLEDMASQMAAAHARDPSKG
jgi:hypothetical protein